MTKPAKPNKSAGKPAPHQGGNPSPQEVNALVSLFNRGRYTEAATLAQTMTVRFPMHGFGWMVLGAVFKQLGRSADALLPMQKAAALSPHDADAHNNLGVTLQELGRLDEAEASLRRALQINPDNATAHNNLGNVLHDLSRLGEAEASYRRALQASPEYAQAHYNLGNTLKESGRLNEAEASYRQALRIKPDYAKAHNNLGVTLKELGRPDEAEACLRRALQLNPDYAEAHCNLGATLRELGRPDEAEAGLRRALKLNPDYAEAHCNLGITLNETERPGEAEASLRRALQLNPDYAEAYCNLGVALKELGRLSEAEAGYRRALQLNPDNAIAHSNLGNTLKELGRPDEAIASLRRALQLKPDYVEAHCNLGIILQDAGRLDEAEASCRHALQLKPDYAQAHNSLGAILQDAGRLDEAEASYRRALQIKPDYADAQWNLGLVLLALGQFQCGWQRYEMRWKRKKAKRLPDTPYPCWLGEEDIAGKKLLIQVEQGFGDTIQMLRYIPLLEQKNIECWIQVPNSLHRLIARSFPRSKVVEPHICPEGLDYRIPVMSLPLAMQTFSEQSIPRHVPYLIPDDGRVGFWQKQLTSTRSKNVGLVWRGNPEHKNDHYRSASLIDLLPLIAACPSIQFVTLQKNLTDAERNVLKEYNNTRMLDEELTDFDETAAVMCNMDIVISVDSAPAHLSGALGKPTWILLWFGMEWRWSVDRADSPWYPTAKLFRQKTIGDWAEVVINVKTSLLESVVQAVEQPNAEHQHAFREIATRFVDSPEKHHDQARQAQ